MKLKKILLLTTIVMVTLMLTVGTSFAMSEVIAKPTASEVMVNGTSIEFEAYNIDGNNYFKLRDIAKVVSGTEKQFAVGWDSSNKAISLTSSNAYTSVGGELAKGNGLKKTATMSTSKIYKDRSLVNGLTSYNINGNTFFKLRDIAKAFNIGIGYDNATKRIAVDTTIGYVATDVVAEKSPNVNEAHARIEAEDTKNTIVGYARNDRILDDGGGVAIGYFQRQGESITFNSCPSATSLTFRYANIIDTTGVMLIVDGKKIDTLLFPNTDGYNTYKKITFNANIPQNANVKIKLGSSGALNIDYIDFNGVCTLPRDIVIEEDESHEIRVENGTAEVSDSIPRSKPLSKPVKITPGYTGYTVVSSTKSSIRREAEGPGVVIKGDTRIEGLSSGGSALAYFETQGESITFKNCPAATAINFRYATPKSASSAVLYVNGKKAKSIGFKSTGGYYTYGDRELKVTIPEGADVKILLISSCAGVNLDYVEFINE